MGAPHSVATVYQAGGYYTREWVDKLALSLGAYGLTLHAITDAPWPGWWSKMELFRPGRLAAHPTLYVDLDTLVVGDPTELLSYAGDLAMISDFYRPDLLQSGVMLIRPGSEPARRVWDAWSRDPVEHMRAYRGDGEFVRSVVPDADRLDRLYPRQVVSLKRDALHACPPDARLVCAHGTPKFDSAAAGWAHEAWAAL